MMHTAEQKTNKTCVHNKGTYLETMFSPNRAENLATRIADGGRNVYGNENRRTFRVADIRVPERPN